jgi:hypothetical protein
MKIRLDPVGTFVSILTLGGMWALSHSWGVLLLGLGIAPILTCKKDENDTDYESRV